MYVDASTVVEAVALVTGLVAIFTLVRKGCRWLDLQGQQTKDIEALRAKEEQDIQGIKDEMCLLTYGLLACLDGLHQLGANGEVTAAKGKLEKHINQQAHGQR